MHSVSKKRAWYQGLIQLPCGGEQLEKREQISAAKKAPLNRKILRSLLKLINKISVMNQTAISSQPIILCHNGGKGMAQIVDKIDAQPRRMAGV